MLPMDNWVKVSQQVVTHCVATQSRVAILDVYNGDKKRDYSDADDIISGRNGFRGRVTLDPDSRRYAAAYYPWLKVAWWIPARLPTALFRMTPRPRW